MTARESWYRCEACNVPASAERPLARASVKGDPRANWRIHPECKDALQTTLKNGVVLEISQS